jgi:tape measure domain-containing protein
MAFMNEKARVKLQLDDVQFKQKLAQAKQMMKVTGQGMASGGGMGIGTIIGGGLALGGISMAVSQVQSMASSAFAYNAAIEKSTVSFSTLLGSEKRAVSLMGQLQKFAADTPFELPTLNQAAVSLLATKKIAQSQVLPILTKLGDAAAGSSEGFASMPRITRAVAQMLTKGKIQAEEMMQLSEAGVPAWTALAQKMGKSTAEVQKLSEKGKLGTKEIMLLVDGLGDTYAGLAAKQSQTYEGLSSTIKDNIGKALGEAFKPLYDFTTKGMKRVVKVLDSPAFANFVGKFASGLQRSLEFAERLANNPLTKAVVKFAALTAGAIALASSISMIGTGVAAVFSMAPIVAFGAALGYVVSLFHEAFAGPTGPEFVGMLRESWGLLKEIGANVSDALMPAFNSLAEIAGVTFGTGGTLQEGFNGFIRSALNGMRSLLDQVSILTADFGKTWELSKMSADYAISYMGDRFLHLFNVQVPFAAAGMFDGMLAAGRVFIDKWRTLFEAMFESVGMLINGMIDAQRARIDGLVRGLEAIKAGRIGDAMAEVGKGMIEAEAISGKAKLDAASSFAAKTGPVFSDALKSFTGAFSQTMKAAPAFQESEATKSIGDAIRQQWDAMKAARDQKREDRFSTMDRLGGAVDGIAGAFQAVGTDVFANLKSGFMAAAEAKPVADITKQVGGILDFFTPPEAKGKKDQKSEFVGFAEMNKRIQGALGKSTEAADRKQMLKLNEQQKKNLDELVTTGKGTVTVLGDIVKKLGLQ